MSESRNEAPAGEGREKMEHVRLATSCKIAFFLIRFPSPHQYLHQQMALQCISLHLLTVCNSPSANICSRDLAFHHTPKDESLNNFCYRFDDDGREEGKKSFTELAHPTKSNHHRGKIEKDPVRAGNKSIKTKTLLRACVLSYMSTIIEFFFPPWSSHVRGRSHNIVKGKRGKFRLRELSKLAQRPRCHPMLRADETFH